MKKISILLIIIIFCISLYSRYIEINLFSINEYNIDIEIPDSYKDLKIIHFSDTLINKEFSAIDLQNLIDNINIHNPDIVFFTGDLIDNEYSVSEDEINYITEILSSLEVSLYKFSVFGDNDLSNKDTYKAIMNESDFTLLDNQTFTFFYKNHTPITITGITNTKNLDDAYITEIDTSNSINFTLTHKPDVFSELINANVVFAGHSLGNYVKLPLIGSVFHKSGASIYYDDYLNYNGKLLYISNGIGTEKYHIRFNNIPSINVYKFV